MPVHLQTEPGDAIAIVGIGGIFAASGSPYELWSHIQAGTDVTREVPPDRWIIDPADALHPRIAQPDHVYTIRGGFVGPVHFDPTGTGVGHDLIERLDPVFHLALSATKQAWDEVNTDLVDLGRAGVVFGNIVLPTETASASSLDLLGRAFEERLGVPAKPPSTFEPRNAFPAGLPAAIVAEAFGLHGVAYTLDAACGSSLYALKLAVEELQSGRADVMITGGVSRPDALYTQMGFSQLRALSARGRAAPFDYRADGLIVGEGAGMFVLKRLGDAIRASDHIHGVIAGIGLSNDVQGDLMAPDSEGQLRAMRTAYDQAGWSPPDVDLIECHATGTPRGDAVEIASLKALWGETGWRSGQCAIGSIKANIGHTLTAAGAAGLLKVLLALKYRTLPPTANFERPGPQLGLDYGPFRVLTRAEPWPARDAGHPRRAAISGFGFGGINAHVLIEEWVTADRSGSVRTRHPAASATEPAQIAVVGMAARVGMLEGRDAFQELVFGPEDGSPDRRISSLELPLGRFRIPPRELEEMLPQQSLMLRVAAEAVGDAGWDERMAMRTGVLVGIGLDLNTTNFYLRWAMAIKADRWNQHLGPELSPDQLAGRIDELREAAGPALSANRTMGSLGGLVASRIARAFRIGGPSFTVSCDETSGTQALAVAVDWLRRGEVDAAVVGAVDFASDDRAVLARCRLGGPNPVVADAAVCLILKRLDDARRDDDRIDAVIRHIATSSGGGVGEIGEYGAATGLARVVGMAAALHDQILPATVRDDTAQRRRPARFWLRNRTEEPRRATVITASVAGQETRMMLEEAPTSGRRSRRPQSRLAAPASLRRSGLFALEGRDDSAILERIRELEDQIRGSGDIPIDRLARRWWQEHPNDPRSTYGLAIVADGVKPLGDLLQQAKRLACDPHRSPDYHCAGGTIHLPREGTPRGVAMVYPGLGNYFDGMGRDLGLLWPEVLRRQDEENRSLRDQLAPDVWWDNALPLTFADHRVPILGQVALGCLVTDILRGLGIEPNAAIGYSMGESAALVALRAWSNRDELMGRLKSSPLFATELAGSCEAARRAWGIRHDQPVTWVAGIVPRSVEDVRKAIMAAGAVRAYVLIRNTSDETVMGGERSAVQGVVQTLGCPWLELPAVSTVHCEIGRLVEDQYRALHDVETAAPPGIAFYSAVSGQHYAVDRWSAARVIAAQASQPIDFARTIENAYADGIGVFIEVGPRSSCTRIIKRILGDRPHVARSACWPGRDPFAAVLEVLADGIAHRLPVDLSSLYDGDCNRVPDSESRPRRTIRVAVGPVDFKVPSLPSPPRRPTMTLTPPANPQSGDPGDNPLTSSSRVDPAIVPLTSGLEALAGPIYDAERARLQAHRTFLRLAQGAADVISRHLAFQLELFQWDKNVGWVQPAGTSHGEPTGGAERSSAPPTLQHREAVLYDRRQCLELAVGSVAAVFGPDFAEVDRLPTRVRLPDGPLMLVDRILALEGTPRSLDKGRILTEHDVLPGTWYLDGDRVAACVAMEAGQADLVLSGYLGVDFVTLGRSFYRLLDANVTFHRGLPEVGDVLRYDIRITRFFRHGTTTLFRFEYDATVGGEPLITMRDGCAGFFTTVELASGKGIVPGGLQSAARPQTAIDREDDLIATFPTQLDEAAVEALRRGDLAAAFGDPFDELVIPAPVCLPGGLMGIIRRVTTLDPGGGPAGLGIIRAEADVQPGDWYLVCHFVDDCVMPGTLMYECCLHALRILMTRLGWIGPQGQVAFEPVPGVANRLKCRGQITGATRRVAYEIAITERGYRPEPYAIADALIIADGRPIVSVTDLSLQLSGTDREGLERLWGGCPHEERSTR
jgi:acyl transferase domain-containing protein/3-hydroxymyristoyl/3-hydroxydecanoyl-(acyl carrier protein) dehydratase